MMISTQVHNSPKESASRIQSLRQYLRFSRAKLCEKYPELSPRTLQNWELGVYGGLTLKGAHKLMAIFQQEGLRCTPEWLLYGLGENPISDPANWHHELNLFYQQHTNAVDLIIKDESMIPYLLPGDHVAGIRYFNRDLDQATNRVCIIHLHDGTISARIFKNTEPNLYTLSSSNPPDLLTSVKKSQIFSVAPIMWLRRETKEHPDMLT